MTFYRNRDDERCDFSIALPRWLIRRVVARAAMEDREVSDVTALALKTYLEAHQQVEGCGNQLPEGELVDDQIDQDDEEPGSTSSRR